MGRGRPAEPAEAGAPSRQAIARRALATTLLAPLALYAGALLIRLWVITGVSFPINEGSAYYAAVARNFVTGRGLVTDALGSYATPPLVVPRPAFELWQPMAAFISAVPMALFGPTFDSAQLGAAAFGALAAPLCWAIAREAATVLELKPRRAAAVALGSGVLAAVLGPFLMAVAVPDSTTPFLVLGLACCWLMPRALSGNRATGLVLGAALGLAYLARLEAIYLALAFVLLAGRRWQLLLPVIAGGILVAVPWLARNALAFGTLFPGQAIENVFFIRNEDVFAYLERPSLARFLAQGPEVIAGNIGRALTYDLIDVLLVRAAPVALIGVVAAIWLARRNALRSSALTALLLSGGLTYLAVSVVFPVATLWGTFEHASGPLLAGLTISAVLGTDALVARVRSARGWQRSNAWLGPLALVVLTLPIAFLQVGPLGAIARTEAAQFEALGRAVLAQPSLAPRVISDHPVWLADATGLPVLALPDEPPANVARLAAALDAPLIVLLEPRGRFPDAFRTGEGRVCFEEQALSPDAPAESSIFALRPECDG